MTTAESKPIPGYPGYAITSDGVLRGPSGKILKTRENRKHLYVVTSPRTGVPRKLYIHRAVLLAWVGPPSDSKSQGLHFNDDPSDNRVENLRWGTPQDNADDKVRNGRQPRGERSASAKLTRAQVLEIRDRRPAETLRSLASEFGVSHTAIRRAANGTKWSHL